MTDQTESIESQNFETVPEKPVRRRRIVWMLGLGVLVAALIGAAFLAGRLLNAQTGPGMTVGPLSVPGGGISSSAVQSVKIDMGEPPEELPLTEADAIGAFVKRSDNILTISTGKPEGGVIVMEGSSSSGGSPQITTQLNDGPQQEVVVAKTTKIYRDSTFDDLKGGMPDPDQKIQRKVAEASLDEIGENSFITVWGRKSGDRIIADVLFFSSPMIFQKADH